MYSGQGRGGSGSVGVSVVALTGYINMAAVIMKILHSPFTSASYQRFFSVSLHEIKRFCQQNVCIYSLCYRITLNVFFKYLNKHGKCREKCGSAMLRSGARRKHVNKGLLVNKGVIRNPFRNTFITFITYNTD